MLGTSEHFLSGRSSGMLPGVSTSHKVPRVPIVLSSAQSNAADPQTPQHASTSGYHPLYRPPIARIPPRRLTLPNNLNHLPPSQTQIPRNRIPRLNPRQLTFLQPIPLQQLLLLIHTQQHMLRHQLMMRNIHQQILLLEGLDHDGVHRWDDF